MSNNQKMTQLACELKQQISQAKKTLEELSLLAKKSDIHEIKWLVLTELKPNFSEARLPHYVSLLEEALKKKE